MRLSTLLAALETAQPGLEIDHLERTATGQLRLHHYGHGALQQEVLAPDGGLHPKPKPGALHSFAQSLHRAFFLGRPGRIISGVLGGVMVLMSVTGLRLALRRAGGWRGLVAPASGAGAGRWHVIAAQLALLPLMILSVTAVWMSLATFGVIPVDLPRLKGLPDSTKADSWPPASQLAPLDVPLAEVQELTFPIPGDWFDVYVLQTNSARIAVDQATGAVLARHPLPLAYRANRLLYRLHSGEGFRLWAGVLGLSALAIPVFAVTGGVLFFRRKARRPRGPNSAPTMIYVGSENGSTWGFAHALHETLKAAGQAVGLADLNRLSHAGPHTHTALILTATYGDGAPPANAHGAQVHGAHPLRYAVLGFGDRQFPAFCAHAERMDAAMAAAGHKPLLPLEKIHQQSGQSFTAWAGALGRSLDLPLTPKLKTRRLKTRPAVVVSAAHFQGREAITSVLRLKASGALTYQAGDLVALQPDGVDAPRLYSIASAPQSPTLDLVVREHKGGQCSPWLCNLTPGDRLHLATRAHPFRLPPKGPVIMVATGTGIAPFIGMTAQTRARDITLLWGMRYAPDAYPFRDDLAARNLHFWPAFSAQNRRVTDLIHEHAAHLRPRLVDQPGTVMICGSIAAAADIRAALSDILSGSGLTPEDLKRQKRLLEDVY